MELTYDRGIVDRIIESNGVPSSGLPFDENQEPRVIQVVEYLTRASHRRKPLYVVIFEGESEPDYGEVVWSAE